MMKAQTTKLSRVGEDQRAFTLIQSEVIVFARGKIRRFDADFTSHAEMNPKPFVARKSEQHSFSAYARIQQPFADKILLKRARVRSAKNAVPRMQAEIDNFVATSGIPLLTIPLDLGQFRHRGEYVAQPCCRPAAQIPTVTVLCSGLRRVLSLFMEK